MIVITPSATPKPKTVQQFIITDRPNKVVDLVIGQWVEVDSFQLPVLTDYLLMIDYSFMVGEPAVINPDNTIGFMPDYDLTKRYVFRYTIADKVDYFVGMEGIYYPLSRIVDVSTITVEDMNARLDVIGPEGGLTISNIASSIVTF